MAYTTIDDPSAHFQSAVWSGTGSALSVTFGGNSDMQPDMVWVKNRTVSSDHRLSDSVRGTSSHLVPNDSAAIDTSSTALTAFNSDGFSVGSEQSYSKSGSSHVGWGWKAGGSTSTNTAGSLDSTTSVNTTAGFSIVTWTGNGSAETIGHGLGSIPKTVIVKRLNAVEHWQVYHANVGGTKYLQLSTNDAEATASSRWANSAPTANVFYVGGHASTNADGSTYVAYCWAEKKGYSKFGIYTGNGAASDGPMTYLGFRPSYLIIKTNSHADDWRLLDDKRSSTGPSNPIDKHLYAHTSGTEAGSSTDGVPDGVDFLSNGFKIRQATNGLNRSGGTYIYMAWAASPFVNSNGIPTTAF